MFSQFQPFKKSKPKMNPMDMDFDFMIKNYPEFFTKLSSQKFDTTPRRPQKNLLCVKSLLSKSRKPRRDIKTENISANTDAKCETKE
jgi:hypothetical protein